MKEWSEEEKKAIGWLSALDIKSEYEATNKEIVLNLINKQEKAIDRMAEKIKKDTEWFYSEFDNKSKEEIKEYFMEDKE